MEIESTLRSAQVTTTLILQDAPIVTLANGTKVQPHSLSIMYTNSEFRGATWSAVAFKVRANGLVGRAEKRISAFSLETVSWPNVADNTPEWITELVAEHAPKYPLKDI